MNLNFKKMVIKYTSSGRLRFKIVGIYFGCIVHKYFFLKNTCEKFAFFLLEFHQTISDLSITVTMTQIYDNVYYILPRKAEKNDPRFDPVYPSLEKVPDYLITFETSLHKK